MAKFEFLSANTPQTAVFKGKCDAAGLSVISCSNFLPLEVEIGIYLWDRAFSPIRMKLFYSCSCRENTYLLFLKVFPNEDYGIYIFSLI